MSITKNLENAKALINSPGKWCKFQMHRRVRRYWLFSQDQYCLSGAMFSSGSMNDTKPLVTDSIRVLFPEGPSHPTFSDYISRFNDDPDTTHKDVMLVLDHAIAKSKEVA